MMESKTCIDKYNRSHIMRIFVDTGVPVEYMLDDDMMDAVMDQLLSGINKMSMLNDVLFNSELNDTVNRIFLFLSIICSQVLRDMDKYDIRNITDIAEYVQRRNITSEDLKLSITIVAMVKGNNKLDMDTIISLMGLSLTSYLEDNTSILDNIMDSMDVYVNTLDVDDLVYNI